MTWNHRVIKRTFPDSADPSTYFGIHEVFYAPEGMSCTTEPVDVFSDSVEGLRETLERMLRALDKPVLDYAVDFPERP